MPKETKNGKNQPIVDHCFDLFDKFSDSDYRKKKVDDIEESYRVYDQEEPTEDKFWKGESKLVLPLLSITVDNMDPRLVSGLVGKPPLVELQMDGLTKQDEPREIIQNWFNEELFNTVKIGAVARTIVHKAQLEGTVYPIVEYDEDEITRRRFKYQEVPVMDQNTGQQAFNPQTGEPTFEETANISFEDGEAQTVDVIENIFKGGRVKFADFKDVYTSDDASDWHTSDVIRVVRLTYGSLVNKKDQLGYITENITPELLGEQIETLENEEMPAIGDIEVLGKKVIECIECSIRFVDKKEKDDEDVTDWTEERWVVLIAKESKTILRRVKLIELNFKNEHLIKRVRYFSEEGKAYGTSMYEKLKAIQNGATDIYNQAINAMMITIIPWFLYEDDSGMEDVKELEPGKGIRVENSASVQFPRFSQNPRSAISFIEMFMSLWEKVGSIGNIQIGQISEGSKDVTATETMAAIQEGNIKHNYQAISLKEDFVEVIRTIYDMYYQKMPFDETFEFRGQKVPIPRKAMERRYTFKIVASSDLSNKALRSQRAELQYSKLRGDPLANGMKLLTDLVSAFDEDAKPEEYIDQGFNQIAQAIQANPELRQVIQQYLEQKQAQAGAAQQQERTTQAVNAGTAAGNAIVKGAQNA